MNELTDAQLKQLIALPDISFKDDEQREDFRDAVLSAINAFDKSENPDSDHDTLLEIGDSILIARGFDPVKWSEHLWHAASVARQATGNA